ncbi:phospholipase DDHD2 [Tribolium castaneum]|nr:PREDICTED: phospholipase DDHD2 isoform X1 [Tribolium castaneum]|eukprot:XP_008200242.1 PREDICTED: phospholipase DDHD2 isoform X1 [Tribolium castaneum]
MTDFNKKVKNPLFNNAVTGGTIEDFAQNALLLPAKEKTPPPPPPVLNLEPDQLARAEAPSFLEPIPTNLATFQNQDHPPQHQTSNLSSVFSSFSNILKLKEPQPEIAPPPAGIDSILSQPPTNVAPVPLFPPSGITNTPPSAPPQAPSNTYRRPGLKRPVYAQVPGLSNSSQPPPQPNPFPPPPAQFKLIAPQPTTFLNPVQPSFFTPVASNLQSPVMAAIPANELLQTPDASQGLPAGVNGEALPAANAPNQVYRPVYHHWFFKREIEGKTVWQPFSMVDSLALEQAFTSNDLDPDKVVATDGGRYDVNILRRQRDPVYWKGSASEVRRCSWFHKGNSDGRYVPYEENVATKLEEEFKTAFETNQWHRKVELANGETVVFHAPDVLVLFPPTQSPDAWGNTPNQLRPRVVKRGMDEFDIDEGEPAKVDHLLFLVHGIGSVCDLKFRTVEEVVDEFRSISLQLVQSHYKSSCEKGIANRIEVLPISWHEELHSEDTGIDRKLKSITLDSIPRLRDFTNDTLLDILFYTSPVYCQTIISTVGNQLNKIFELFKQRNPDFNGGISLGGHSLGSLILFDLLCHQHPEPDKPSPAEDEDTIAPLNDTKPPPLLRRMSRRISYMMGAVGTGQPQIHYPHLIFQPKAFFALGSPIGMFVTVRGLDTLGEQFALPTCPAFFNIFHPYDPVAYRIESLINPELSKLKPVLIPHHKGRKRMHLELKETMARVGADLKQRIIDSMKSTWNSFYQLAMFHRQDEASLEAEVDKALQEQLRKQEEIESEEPEQPTTDLPLGILNNNRRIDYVLQEAPFEFFNEYIFALTSHVCYWESEDTMLLILKEIYSSMNISTDDKIPQQTMTIERPPPSPKSQRPGAVQPDAFGMDPTAPMQRAANLGPPPMTGFVKKT